LEWFAATVAALEQLEMPSSEHSAIANVKIDSRRLAAPE
jgi:hypothetical protein